MPTVFPVRLSATFGRIRSLLVVKANVAPWWPYVHLVAFVAFALRLTLAWLGDHINHPDEIFQYLEQGHKLAFGYGIVPWEYRFGTRSLVIPELLGLCLRACHSVHLEEPGQYVPAIKGFFCALSTSLVYSAYATARRLHSETAGRLAAIFVAVWYELVYFAHKPTPEILATYALVGALACSLAEPRRFIPYVVGLLCGLCAVLRFQYIPAVAVLGLVLCFTWRIAAIAACAGCAGVVVLAAGWVDHVTWGGYFISYYNSYVFNKVHNVSEFFGVRPAYYYLAVMAIASLGITPVAAALSLLRLRATWLPLSLALGIVLFHMTIPHKEYRFVIGAIPLLLIALAIVASELRSRLPIVVAGVILVSTVGVLHKLPFAQKAYHEPLYSRQPSLVAYEFLNHERGLVAVLNEYSPVGETGGYYYLHRNVPTYLPEHFAKTGHSIGEASHFVSHLMCRASRPPLPGFEPVFRVGDLEIRRHVEPSEPYSALAVDTQAFLFPGIDGVYPPLKLRTF